MSSLVQQIVAPCTLVFPLILFLEALSFAQLGIGFLKSYIQRISRFLTFLLCFLPFEFQLAIMPAHSIHPLRSYQMAEVSC